MSRFDVIALLWGSPRPRPVLAPRAPKPQPSGRPRLTDPASSAPGHPQGRPTLGPRAPKLPLRPSTTNLVDAALGHLQGRPACPTLPATPPRGPGFHIPFWPNTSSITAILARLDSWPTSGPGAPKLRLWPTKSIQGALRPLQSCESLSPHAAINATLSRVRDRLALSAQAPKLPPRPTGPASSVLERLRNGPTWPTRPVRALAAPAGPQPVPVPAPAGPEARLLVAYSEPLLTFLEAQRVTLVWAAKAAARQAYVGSGLEYVLATFGEDLRFFMAMGAGAILDDHRLALVACAIFTSVIAAILALVGLTALVLGLQIHRTGSPSSPRHPFVLGGSFLGVALSLGGLEGALVAAVAWACLGLATMAERARLPWAQWARSGEAQHWAMRPNGRPAAMYPHSWRVYTAVARALAGLGRLSREQGGALWRRARPLLGAPRALGPLLGHTYPAPAGLGSPTPARRRLRHVHLASELEIFWTGKGSIFALTFLLLSFSARALLVIVGAGLL